MITWTDWLDQRLDYRKGIRHWRRRVLPHGPGWAYTSASCLLWLLVIQCVTGLLLMATYSPSMASAWASVHFIDRTMAGRFLRGMHHYASHAMIILFAVHVIRVLVTGAYRAPREFVWITGLMLFPLVIVWTVTGNPLSASQKGIAQIQVEGNILRATPFLGPFLQRLLLGGDEVGTLTLTRLYFLHVGLLPLLVGGLSLLHLHQVIKHGSYRPEDSDEASSATSLSAPLTTAQLPIAPQSSAMTYWPHQTIRNMISLAVIVGTLALIAWFHGAPLPAPADPDIAHSPRPEWYFRWLFELRRHFTGNWEFVATLVVPTAFLAAFMSAPFFDRFSSNRISTVCRWFVVAGCCGGWMWLTLLSYSSDWHDAEYQADCRRFDALSERALELARTEPITELGAIQLLRNDPQTQGPLIFARHCNGCHSHTDSTGQGLIASEISAPNLYGIGSREWIAGFLDPEQIVSDDNFGRTSFREGDMVQHVQGMFSAADAETVTAKKEMLEAIAAALAAEAGTEPPDSPLAARGRLEIAAGGGCTDCHRFHEHGEIGSAPDLTGYASTDWLKQMISRPNDSRFYGERSDRMPAYAADAKHPELNLLSSRELDLLVQWLRMTNGQPAPSIGQSQRSGHTQPAPLPHAIAIP